MNIFKWSIKYQNEIAALSNTLFSYYTGISEPASYHSEASTVYIRNNHYFVTSMATSSGAVSDTEMGLASYSGEAEPVKVKATNRLVLDLACPCTLDLEKADDGGEQVHNWWTCETCYEVLDYAFDQYFYCNCGRIERDRFSYKCNRRCHGKDFKTFPDGHVKNVMKEVKPKQEMNILILGETGVGKSTWINSIVNYMTYPSLDVARKQENLLSLIGATFTITDENFEETDIKIGDDKNEVHGGGQSATQSPKAYVFEHEEKLIRLIDTPGIGDTRGIEQDKKNFDVILKYLANLDKLNGICILLKPNNARLTVMFRFCIKELLTHLHKDAGRNIVFCFTNARGTFYKPGDTLPPLKKLLQESKNAEIQLNKNNVYCMDNEAFRFLCALHHGIEFDENDMKNYSASWDKSVAETTRMFDMIATLKPHKLKETISLNEARKVIVTLTKPMADISQNIQANIAVVEDKKREIETSKLSQAELAKKLYIPAIELVPKQLGYPRTVCTSTGCVRYHTIPGTNQTTTDYTSHCHTQCYLKGVTVERYPNPDLQQCSAMRGSMNCKKCGCSWSKHMHITYEYSQTSRQVLDQSIQDLINSKKSIQEKTEIHIQTLSTRVSSLQTEQRFITNASAKFGCFLKTNAITPYNDAMAEYLDMLIGQERQKVSAGGDQHTLDGLISMKQSYYEEVNILEHSMNSEENSSHTLGPQDVQNMVQELYTLPLNGTTLRDTVEVARAGTSQMMSYSEVLYRPKMTRFQNFRAKTKRIWQTLSYY